MNNGFIVLLAFQVVGGLYKAYEKTKKIKAIKKGQMSYVQVLMPTYDAERLGLTEDEITNEQKKELKKLFN